MKQAFVIMQIGNADLDKIYHKVMVPAIKLCNLEPKRVDKHNEGRLLKSEIVGFIEESDIIIADLTNERPNCYLEIGYAMGLDKFKNLILTAREDHNQDSPNYIKNGPKVHFDLSGYDILFWDPKNPEKFQSELESRIRRRLSVIVSSTVEAEKIWDEEWLSKYREIAFSEFGKHNLPGYMEIRMTLPNQRLNIPQSDLLDIARKAQIFTFGWPIGIVGREGTAIPKPKTDGIVSLVLSLDLVSGKPIFDFWTMHKNGSFYLLMGLYEDQVTSSHIFFDTRIIRITETLLHAVRLYSGCKVPLDARILIGIKHGGLKDRSIGVADTRRHLSYKPKSEEDEIDNVIDTTLERIEPDLIGLVEQIVDPLFTLFNFWKVEKNILEEIVNKFVVDTAK